MISKVLAGGAVVLALCAGQAVAQQPSADVAASGGTSTPAEGNVGQGIAETLNATKAGEAAIPGAGAPVTGASAQPARKARRGRKGNVVTSTLAGVPGLVGSTVGGGLGQAGSTIGGTVGGALGVDKPKPDETPSRP